MTVSRRNFLSGMVATAGASVLAAGCAAGTDGARSGPVGGSVAAGTTTGSTPPGWPSAAAWQRLREQVGGRLIAVESPLHSCLADAASAACSVAVKSMQNPFFNEDHAGATQSTGWYGAWSTAVSPYAVAATSAADIAAAVNFARDHRVRLVVKGTGHDYLGRSNAPDSLLVWTHNMRKVTTHDSFRIVGGSASDSGIPAITIEAGARWLEAYGAAAAAGRYVQGGGCTSVGACGGFVQGNGYGSYSKRFGTGAGGMLQVEVVTADGEVVVANEAQNQDLFWAIRGGGGGTWGVMSKVTLRTHPMPGMAGSVAGTLIAKSDEAFRDLVTRFLQLYAVSMNNERWGEQFTIAGDNTIKLGMTFLDLDEASARAVLRPLLDWMASQPVRYSSQLTYTVRPFKDNWNADWWRQNNPQHIVVDPRTGQPASQYWWASNQGEVSAFIHSYQSRWLPLAMFDAARVDALARMLIAASREWDVGVHVNKGLAGANRDAVARDRKTCVNPVVFDAAGLIILSGGQQAVFPGVRGKEPDMAEARTNAARIGRAMRIIRDATPMSGAYMNEADYFEPDWQRSFWGDHYPRLLEVKRRVDPTNLFRVHHGVGSES